MTRYILAICFILALQIKGFCQPSVNGLIAYLPFNDGTAKDWSWNQHQFQMHNVTLAPDRFGREDSACYLNGIDSVITAEVPLPKASEPRTISLWVKPDIARLQPNSHLVFWGNDLDSEGFGIMTTGPEPPGWRLTTGAGTGLFGATFYDTNWVNLTVTWDGKYGESWESAYLRCYINGVERRWLPRVQLRTGISKLHIGGSFPNKMFSGWVDEIRIYNRALSESEIMKLHAYESIGAVSLSIKTSTVRLEWPSEAGVKYNVQWSTNFQTWLTSETVVGTGNTLQVDQQVTTPSRAFRVIKE